jgi:predicted RNase H-like HicB family nuclease
MGILTDYISSALKQANYRPGEGGFFEATVPGLSNLLVRGRSFEECRERLQTELELFLAKSLLAHEAIPELSGVDHALQELALTVHPTSSPTEQALLQTTRTILEEVRALRRGGGGGKPDHRPPQPQPKPEPKKPSTRVGDYLAEVGLQLQLSRNGGPDAEEKALDRISAFIGERFAAIEPLYDKMKTAAAKSTNAKGGFEFQLSLKSASQQDIGSITQLCVLLKEAGVLQSYTYNSTQRRVYAKLSSDGRLQNFVTGGWLERYVKQETSLALKRRNLQHDLLYNALIVYPNGDKFEVDLLARTLNTFVMVECKTGNYEEALDRHVRMAQDLRIPAKQVLYVLLGVDEKVLDELTRQWGFTFANEKILGERLERLLS